MGSRLISLPTSLLQQHNLRFQTWLVTSQPLPHKSFLLVFLLSCITNDLREIMILKKCEWTEYLCWTVYKGLWCTIRFAFDATRAVRIRSHDQTSSYNSWRVPPRHPEIIRGHYNTTEICSGCAGYYSDYTLRLEPVLYNLFFNIPLAQPQTRVPLQAI